MMDRQIVEEKLQEITQKIAEQFQPEKIILFGSYAWGDPGPDSDVDLFIVKETDNTRQLAMEIDAALWGRLIPVDILVYKPESVEKRLAMDDFFIRKVIMKGKVLYERK